MSFVLLYHHIASGDSLNTHIPPTVFQEQIQWLIHNDYRISPLSQYMDADSDAKTVFITFDDGYQNIFLSALPILKAEGTVASVFMITDYINSHNQWEHSGLPVARHLTEKQIDALCQHGWEIHSHTAAHANFRHLSDNEIEDDVNRATCVIRRWNRGKVFCAYPYGRSEPRLIHALQQSHYAGAFIAQASWVGYDQFRLPRIPITTSNLSTFAEIFTKGGSQC